MAFRFRLFLPDGEELPDFHCAVPNWLPGDDLMITPQEQYRVLGCDLRRRDRQ